MAALLSSRMMRCGTPLAPVFESKMVVSLVQQIRHSLPKNSLRTSTSK